VSLPDPDDNAALINGLISNIEEAAASLRSVCSENDIPFESAVVMLGINGSYITPLLRALHALKATSAKIDILESQFKRECDDTDALLRYLGVAPEDARTDGGSLRINHIKTVFRINKG